MIGNRQHAKALQRFIESVTARDVAAVNARTRGQALIEFALVVPLLFVLIAGAIDFGGLIFAWITVAHAARSVAQYAVLGNKWLGAPTVPDLSTDSGKLQQLVNAETAGLPNSSAVTFAICEYNNGSLTKSLGTCSNPPPPIDSETVGGGSTYYTVRSVDVTYSYQPFIPAFSFPTGAGLPGIFGSNIIIHRRTVMRVMQ
jgi:Flp pilus assembly protein TadG